MAMKDDTMEISLMNIPNPHVDGMIIAHLAGPNIVYVTDLISPRGPIGRNPQTVAVGDALRKANITGAIIAAVTAPRRSSPRLVRRWRRTSQRGW